jgi:hypothetical protein
MINYSKIVKIKMDYITKYQYVKLIHFLRRHHTLTKIIYWLDKKNNSERKLEINK